MSNKLFKQGLLNRGLIGLSIIATLITGVATATEFRTPWLSERGSIRYLFENDDEERYSLNTYAIAHRRESHKAFKSHGFSTEPLTSLFFNKADFPIQEIFPNNQIAPTSKYYNPYMALTTLKPRATYYEWGMNLGARFEYPVHEDKGRIGFRINVSIRAIEIEREDITSPVSNPEDEYILSTYTKVGNYASGAANAGNYNPEVDIVAKAYKMDFIASLFQDNARTPALQFTNNSAKIFGVEIARDFHTNDGSFRTDIKPVAGIIKDSGTDFPNEPNFNEWNYTQGVVNDKTVNSSDVQGIGGAGGYGVRAGVVGTSVAVDERHNWAFDAGDDVDQRQAGDVNNAGNDKLQAHRVLASGVMGIGITDNYIMNAPNVYFFDDDGANILAVDYSDFMVNNYPTNMPQAVKAGWLVLGYDNGNLVPGAVAIRDGIENAVKMYNEDPYEWLKNHGDFEFETQRRTGLGDIDLDFFYEHNFLNDWIIELMVGLRLPTGSNDDYSGNAYKAHLGNGEHFEIKLGAMAAVQPADWMNLKLDTYVSFALEATEQRCAVFEGSSIKNIGPKVDADVDWAYFVARLDATFFHPKTNDISGTFGYELYVKGEDNINFKETEMTPFYGDHYNGTTLLKSPLSSSLAEAHTDSISHKLRGEISVRINDWTDLLVGGSFVFAGKNVPREFDGHGGFNIRF